MRRAEELASGADPGDIHIAGILVHCRSEGIDRLAAAIDAMPGADVFQRSPQGKLVVVVEAGSARGVLDLIDAIRALPGVFNVSLVYQHAEPSASLEEALPSAAGTGVPPDPDEFRDAPPVMPGAMEHRE